MDAWARFLDSFFNGALIRQYLPSIAEGTLITIEIAFAIVVTGTVLGLVLAAADGPVLVPGAKP